MEFLKSVFTTVDRYVPAMTEKSKKQIAGLCTPKQLAKNEMLIQEGRLNDQEYLVLDGVLRSFLLNAKGKEVTISFFPGLTVLSPALTRTHAGRSLLNFQALTNAELAQIDARRLEKLIEENLEIREFANLVLRLELMDKVHKEIRMASWTALERLRQFRQTTPHLENLVPHHMVASYLGITNVSLSRLRAAKDVLT